MKKKRPKGNPKHVGHSIYLPVLTLSKMEEISLEGLQYSQIVRGAMEVYLDDPPVFLGRGGTIAAMSVLVHMDVLEEWRIIATDMKKPLARLLRAAVVAYVDQLYQEMCCVPSTTEMQSQTVVETN